MGWGYWGGFAPYVSKAEKIRRAEKACAALVKKGVRLEPVKLNGRKICGTWWGKAWAENLERYADFSNRIPRGRTYVRNGSVLDLKIAANKVTALVAGSRAQPYKIEVRIKPLDKKHEKSLMEKSRASLDSMQVLLSGEFPADLKEEFFKQGTGLFPSPMEIELDCSCPDWADMCKHVAAALYGVGVRLDEKPDLFFVLRGIKIDDFVGTMVKRESEKMLKKSKAVSERAISSEDADMSELFGITLDGVINGSKGIKKHVVRKKVKEKRDSRSVERIAVSSIRKKKRVLNSKPSEKAAKNKRAKSGK
jgi:uncharacterized Zn finger protein